MKKLFLLAAVTLVCGAALVSCSRDDGYSLGNFTVAWGTVGQQGDRLTIARDNGSTLFVVNSRVPLSWFVQGQRVIVDYTILGDDGANPMNFSISVNRLSRILTKGLLLQSFIDADPAVRPDSIGNDPIDVTGAWFGGGFINLRFSALFGNTQAHLITLVQDDVNTPDDTVRLYLHHNAFDDPQNFRASGYAAFNLMSIIPAGQISVPVKLTWTGYDGVTRSDSGTFTWPLTTDTAPVDEPLVYAPEMR